MLRLAVLEIFFLCILGGCDQTPATARQTLEEYLNAEASEKHARMYELLSTPDQETWSFGHFKGQHLYDQILALRLTLTRHQIVSIEDGSEYVLITVKSIYPDMMRISQELFGDKFWREQKKPGAAQKLRAYIREKSSWYSDSSTTEYRLAKEGNEWRIVRDFASREAITPMLISERKLDEAGDIQGALEAVREALAIDPDNKYVQARLASLEKKLGYLSSIRILNLKATKKSVGYPSLRGTIKNIGDHVLSDVNARISYLDRNGEVVADEITLVMMHKGDLKKNYEYDFYHMVSNVPDSWSGEVRVEVLHFKLQDECELVSAHLARWICFDQDI